MMEAAAATPARRWLAASVWGMLATLALLLAVQRLVESQDHRDATPPRDLRLELLRVPPDTETEVRRRHLPDAPAEPERAEEAVRRPLPAPPALAQRSVDTRLADVEVQALPTAGLLTAPDAGGILGDLDVVPLVRVPPEYPPGAARRRLGGWVHLEFTVTATGTVTDVRVIDASPPGVFDDAAVRAARRFKYRPQMRSGSPMDRPGVELLMRFDPGDIR